MQTMKVEIEVEPEQIETLKADDRGRINLGAAMAGQQVRIAVLESEPAAEEK